LWVQVLALAAHQINAHRVLNIERNEKAHFLQEKEIFMLGEATRIPPVNCFDCAEDGLLDLHRMLHRAALQERWGDLDLSGFGVSEPQAKAIAYDAAKAAVSA